MSEQRKQCQHSLPTQLSQQAVSAFCRRHYIRKLALFGSVLHNDFSPESDVDVPVEFEPGHVPGFAFFSLQDELSELLGRPVGLHTPNSPSPYFRQEVVETAAVRFLRHHEQTY